MIVRSIEDLSELYESDETAWLDAMAEIARDGRLDDLDVPHLAEFLSDTAHRDRREVESRLAVLLTHILKWVHQPEKRTRSWRASIIVQQQELEGDIGHGVLRKHATAVLSKVYRKAIARAAAETGLPEAAFPEECAWDLDGLLGFDASTASD